MQHEKELFDNHEKWEAFLQLNSKKDIIRNEWLKKLGSDASSRFKDGFDSWKYSSHGIWNMIWFHEKYRFESIRLMIGWDFEFVLCFDSSMSNQTNRIKDLMNKDIYATLMQDFVTSSYELNIIGRKKLKFNGLTGSELIAWYAGNQTEELLDYIEKEVKGYLNQHAELLINLNRDV